MSDKELEEYINKIEPNFDSHLEKGTIEMSNEYYNLLEEKMVRLINKNQKLKKQLKEYKLITIDYQELEARNKELKERIDKAIEYVKEHRYYAHTIDIDYLLEILRGDKNE